MKTQFGLSKLSCAIYAWNHSDNSLTISNAAASVMPSPSNVVKSGAGTAASILSSVLTSQLAFSKAAMVASVRASNSSRNRLIQGARSPMIARTQLAARMSLLMLKDQLLPFQRA
ncbi:hypothetical protein KCU71_g21444, partial [Aureobasidium melanogenum]